MSAAELVAAIADAPAEELPAVAMALAARLAQMNAAPAPGTKGHQPDESERFLTPEEAAAVAQVPTSRIYQWARDARWASRPTRRCLRIAEAPFRRWLQARGR